MSEAACSKAVVASALSWVGTPYVHQASAKGAGTDCLGLIRGVWREVVGAETEAIPAYTPAWQDVGGREVLWQAAGRHLLTVDGDAPLAAGQVLLFRMQGRSVAKHLGLLVDMSAAPKFVHAYSGRTVEISSLSQPWQSRLVARFLFPAPRS